MNKIYISVLVLLAGLVTACNSLQEEPYGMIVPEEFYRNETDAGVAVIAAYNALISPNYYNGSMYLLSDVITDDTYPGNGSNQNANSIALDNYSFDASHEEFRKVWQACYTGINRANTVIERVPPIAMDTVRRNRLVAEAHFLRALHYFNLVRWFGNVPLLLSSTKNLNNLTVTRTSAKEVYAQIIQDLEVAQQGLPSTYGSGSLGRATNGAAMALLAKVYLTQGNWALAASKAKQVIDSATIKGTYKLFPSYKDIWNVNYQNSQEHIFSVQRGATLYSQAFVPANSNVVSGATSSGGVSVPETSFYDSFSDLDSRKKIAFATNWRSLDGTVKVYEPHIAKYYDPTYNNVYTNMPVIRYAEILLIYAEAVNEIRPGDAEAYNAINQIRKRARNGSTDPDALPDLQDLSQEEFREAVWQERRWELCFEGHRWFDLARTKQLVKVMQAQGKTNVKEAHLLFPVPQHEIAVNPNIAPQNDGYSN
jgi:hypothetical protein